MYELGYKLVHLYKIRNYVGMLTKISELNLKYNA